MVDSFHAFTSAAASHIPHPLDSTPTSYIASHPHTGRKMLCACIQLLAFNSEFKQNSIKI